MAGGSRSSTRDHVSRNGVDQAVHCPSLTVLARGEVKLSQEIRSNLPVQSKRPFWELGLANDGIKTLLATCKSRDKATSPGKVCGQALASAVSFLF